MLDLVNKFPRWALIVCTCIAIFAVRELALNEHGMVKANAEDIVKVKAVAFEAKNTAAQATLQVAALSGQIQEIKNSAEKFRTEYRDDQIRILDKLDAIKNKGAT